MTSTSHDTQPRLLQWGSPACGIALAESSPHRPAIQQQQTGPLRIYVLDVRLQDGPAVRLQDGQRPVTAQHLELDPIHSCNVRVPACGYVVDSEDEDEVAAATTCTATVYGLTPEGASVCVVIQDYMPAARVRGEALHCRTESLTAELRRRQSLQREELTPEDRFHAAQLKMFVPSMEDVTQPMQWEIWRLRAKTLQRLRRCVRTLVKYHGIEELDTCIPVTARARADLQLWPSTWLDLSGGIETWTSSSRVSSCQLEYLAQAQYLRVETVQEVLPPPNLVVSSRDDEMFSRSGRFPRVQNADCTIMVGMATAEMGLGTQDPETKLPRQTRYWAIVLGNWPYAPAGPEERLPDNTTIIQIQHMSHFHEAWAALMRHIDPDLLTGWNLYNFDFPFSEQEYMDWARPAGQRGSEALHAQARQLLGLPQAMSSKAALSRLLAKQKDPDARRALQEQLQRELGAVTLQAMLKGSIHEVPERSAQHVRNLIGRPGTSILEKAQTQVQLLCTELGKVPTRYLLDAPAVTPDLPGLYWSRCRAQATVMQEKIMNTAAKGYNVYSLHSPHGIVEADLMQYHKDTANPPSNALRWAAKEYLGTDMQKMDLDAKDIFKRFAAGGSARHLILAYGLRDCAIPLGIMQQLDVLGTVCELSGLTATPLHEIFNSGQTVRMVNLLNRALGDSYVFNEADTGWPERRTVQQVVAETLERRRQRLAERAEEAAAAHTWFPQAEASVEYGHAAETKRQVWHAMETFWRKHTGYTGAIVQDPVKGFYERLNIVDFQSLYPSIMISFNFCLSTCVAPEYVERLRSHPAFFPVEIEHVDVGSWDADSGTIVERRHKRTYLFNLRHEGVLPRIQRQLLEARSNNKALAKQFKSDPVKYSIYNNRQLGNKVVGNSMYGGLGQGNGTGTSCKPVAAAVTCMGRRLITESWQVVDAAMPETWKLAYGDTDSLFLAERVDQALGDHAAFVAAGTAAADAVTAHWRAYFAQLYAQAFDGSTEQFLHKSRIILEFENVYLNALLMKKKRYIARVAGSDKLVLKGIGAKRRDTPEIVARSQKDIVRALVQAESKEAGRAAAVEALRDWLRQLVQNTLPLQMYRASQSIGENYKSENMPHVQARRRAIERGDSGIVPVGDRQEYIVVERGGKKDPAYKHAETVSWAASQGLKPKRSYYLERVKSACSEIMCLVDQRSSGELFLKAEKLLAAGIGAARLPSPATATAQKVLQKMKAGKLTVTAQRLKQACNTVAIAAGSAVPALAAVGRKRPRSVLLDA